MCRTLCLCSWYSVDFSQQPSKGMFFYFPHFIDDATRYREVLSTSNHRTEINGGQGWKPGCPVVFCPLSSSSVHFSHSVVSDSLQPMDCSAPGFPVNHQLQSLLKLMSVELMMLSNYLILCCPLLLLP